MNTKYVKIIVYVPSSHAEDVRKALAESGAGHIGAYDYCSFTVKGTGRYRGGPDTKPFIGEPGRLEKIEEERIETICPLKKLEEVLKAIKRVHPYEEPAIDIYPLLNEGQL